MQELAAHIKGKTARLIENFHRPTLENFKQAIGKVKGAPGIDQMAGADLKVIGKVPSLVDLVWSVLNVTLGAMFRHSQGSATSVGGLCPEEKSSRCSCVF